jgi:L-lactate dehydrogenase complex protein LldG
MTSRGDREAFLGRVRERLRDGIPENILRPVLDLGGVVPAVEYSADLTDAAAAFTAAAGALGAIVRPDIERDALIREVCKDNDVRRAVVSNDPECEGVGALLGGLGVEVVELGDIAATADVDLGITGAAYGIALTGSLVVDSTRAGARTASLLPPVHLALLRREALLPTPGDLFRHLGERLPDGLPSNLVLITGPSRSADIELQLTVGVHGPRELIIGLLG